MLVSFYYDSDSLPTLTNIYLFCANPTNPESLVIFGMKGASWLNLEINQLYLLSICIIQAQFGRISMYLCNITDVTVCY